MADPATPVSQHDTRRPVVGLAGAGRVATAMGAALVTAGYRVGAVWNRTPAGAAALAQQVDSEAVATPDQLVQACELVLVCVSDDAIADVVARMTADALQYQRDAETAGSVAWRGIVHLSGALAADVMQPQVTSWDYGVLHPARAISTAQASSEASSVDLKGTVFAIESTGTRLRNVLLRVVCELGGHHIIVGSSDKALYHAALTMASNYLVTLKFIAGSLLSDAHIDAAADADRLLLSLMRSTLDNLETRDAAEALTGPIRRGDVTTVAQHLRVLAQHPAAAGVYRTLGRSTVAMLAAHGEMLPPETAAALRDLLGESSDTADL